MPKGRGCRINFHVNHCPKLVAHAKTKGVSVIKVIRCPRGRCGHIKNHFNNKPSWEERERADEARNLFICNKNGTAGAGLYQRYTKC